MTYSRSCVQPSPKQEIKEIAADVLVSRTSTKCASRAGKRYPNSASTSKKMARRPKVPRMERTSFHLPAMPPILTPPPHLPARLILPTAQPQCWRACRVAHHSTKTVPYLFADEENMQILSANEGEIEDNRPAVQRPMTRELVVS